MRKTREQMMLPSGRTFTRNRCSFCESYWDTDHPTRPDETPVHAKGCKAKLVTKAMSELGKRTSKKKAAASRENGKKGGRPKKRETKATRKRSGGLK